jgi:hypothetical protein
MTRRTTRPRRARGAPPGRKPRQEIPTGSIAEILATLRAVTAAGPVHGPDLPKPESIRWRAGLLPAPRSVFPDEDVEAAIGFIASTDLIDRLNKWIDEGKKKQGRPSRTSVLAVLVAMWLSAQDKRGMLVTGFRDILFHRISPAMQAALEVSGTEVPEDPRKRLLFDRAAATSVRRTLHRLLSQVDPSVYPKNRIRSWVDLSDLARDIPTDEQQRLQTALDWVCSQILHASFMAMPEPIRRQYRGSACIDATPLRLFARGRPRHHDFASADPDGGFYVRVGDHRDPDDTVSGDPQDPKQKVVRKSMWAMDISLLVAVDDHPGDRQQFPALAVAMTTDRPGVDQAGAARRVMASFVHRGFRPRYLAGDNLYSAAEASTFQTPARDVGFQLVLGYTKDHLGDQEAHDSGIRLIEGAPYCPAMPSDLVNATRDLREGRITQQQYAAFIQARVLYKMRTQQKPKDGLGERLCCPAAGPNPLVKCNNKPASNEPRPTRQVNGHVTDARLRILPPPDISGDSMPRVCSQQSVTVDASYGAKSRQPLQYGSDEHTDLYNTLRQSQEGLHGFAKDDAHEALAAPGKRRVRGKAAQSLFAAFLLAAANIRKIRAFLTNAKEDEDGALFVPRRQRVRDHARTGLPPGIGPPETAVA